jgi:hypothetical protein
MSIKRVNRIAGQFDAREITMLESPAYRVASRACRMIMDRIAIEYAHHGGNDNGKLPVTYDDLVAYGLHRDAISPAIHEGEALGLFRVTERGRASAGEFRTPNLFRITYRAAGRDPPTNEWKQIKTDEEAIRIAKAARKIRAPKTKFQSRFPANTGHGNHDRKSKSPVTETMTTGTSPETMTTIYISGRGDSLETVTNVTPMTAAERQKRYRDRLRGHMAEKKVPGSAKSGAERARAYRARRRAAMNGHAP